MAVFAGTVAVLTGIVRSSLPLRLLNAVTRRAACTVTRDIPYGPDPRQRLDVHAPPGPIAERPVVLFFYGGRWRSGDKHDYHFVADALTARGLIAVIADYRLYPEVDWPDFIQDGARAYRWMEQSISAYGGDPHQLFVMGHSAGAYIGAMVALDDALRARVGALSCPRGFIGLAGPYDFFPFTDPDVCAVFSSTPDGRGTQPVEYVGAAPPDLLLLTGASDRTVSPLNSVHLKACVEDRDGRATLIRYPRLGHVGLILSLARPFNFLAPSLNDVSEFICSRTTKKAPPLKTGTKHPI